MTMDRILPVGGLGPKAGTDTTAAAVAGLFKVKPLTFEWAKDESRPNPSCWRCEGDGFFAYVLIPYDPGNDPAAGTGKWNANPNHRGRMGFETREAAMAYCEEVIRQQAASEVKHAIDKLALWAEATIERAEPVALAVWYGSMPESNGKANWTATLHRKEADAILEGFCFARSEYPDRVRYEADRMRWIVGDLGERPDILDYDAASHSGYTSPLPAQAPQVPGPKTTEAVAAPFRFDARIEWRGHDDAWLVFAASPSGEWVRAADHDILVADLQTLLARVLVMDLGSAEEAAEALGGFPQVIHLVETHHAAHPRPVHPDTSPDPDEVEF